jgi:hypothetical protein
MVVQSIPLVTDLRTQNRNIGILYIASGSVTPGDSYGGMYLWDATSTAADDSFYVIQVTGVAVGRWIRIGAASNIYTSNGTLLNNRTVTLGGYTLSFAGSLFSTIFNADGTVAFGSLVGVGSRYVVAGPTGVLGTAGTIPGPGTPTRFIETFTASAGQTTFNTANTLYASFFDVFVNGVLLDLSSYTASANQVVLNDPCLLDDIIEVIGFINITYVGTLPPQAGQAGKFLSTDGTSLLWAANPLGTVTSVGLTAPTGFSVSNSPITTSGDLQLSFAAGYALPTTASQTTWDTAYNRSLTSAAVTGTSSKTLTLNKQDGGTITATWSDYDTQGVTSVSVSTGNTGTDFNASVLNPTTTPAITINLPSASATNRGALTSTDWSTFNAKQAAITLTTTGSSGAATFISNTLNIPDYSLALAGYVPTSRTLTINGTTYDLTANRSWSVGTVTSVDLSVPTGLSVSGNPVTGSGTLAITYTTGYSIPTNVKQGNWDDAYTFVAAFPTQTGNAGKWLTTNGSVMSWADITLSNYVPTSRTLTINGVTYDLTADRTWTIVAGVSSVTGTAPISASNVSGAVTISISQSSASTDGYLSSTDWSTFNAKQPAGNYITSLTGEATASGPGAASVTLTNSAVIGKVLTGLNVTGGSISATDSILTAFGKIQNQINALVGGLQYQGTWDANTNTPTLTSSVGTNGYFYIVSVAGSTNLNGITDWKVGDWAVFHASSWQKVDNTESVVSVNGLTGAVVLTTTNIAEGTNLYYTDSRARQSISLTTTGTSGAATYDNTTGVLNIPIYQGGVTSFNTRTGAVTLLDTDVTGALGYTPVTNARTLTINGTTFDLTANRTWSVGTVTSVGLSMPIAFNVTSSPVTGSGTLTVTGAGTASQYVRGDGTLGDFPTGGGGGGASVSYYLNGSVNQGSFGGTTYYEMNKTPILGAGTDFSISSNGYIASFITDPNDPALLNIPGGNWNLEFYFSASSGGGTPTFYVELYKYDGTTFTLIASNSTSPEVITGGTSIDAYFTSLSVPSTALTLTDRLAVRIYVTPAGRTITLHTENNHLCQIITTFTTGLTALNGLTAQVQYFATGTSGTDFNISSSTATHTFNIPTASATNRGALSSADWTTFNDKVPATRTLTINGVGYDLSADRSWTIGPTIYSRGLQRFVATAGQTSFTITNGYTVGLVDVYRNGVKLDNATEFTASNGTTVVLTDAAALNDIIEVYKYGSEYIPNNALRVVNTFTATAAQTTFSVTYSVGLLDVFYNGSKLAAAEYTATNGTTVVFANACTAGDIIEIIAYNYLVNAYAGISGSGNNNYIPKFTSASTIGNSSIQDNGTTITLGAALAGTSATFSGNLSVGAEIFRGVDNSALRIAGGNPAATGGIILLFGSTHATKPNAIELTADGTGYIAMSTNSVTRLTIANNGAATFSGIVGANGATEAGWALKSNGNLKIESNSGTTVLQVSDTSTGGKNWSLISAGAGNVHSVAAGSFYLRNSTDGSTVMTIASTGAAIFTGRVTAGSSLLLGEVQSSYSLIETTAGNGIWLRPVGIASPAGVFVTTGGNVGIGTSSPLTTLTVKSTNDNGFALTRPSNASTYHLAITTTESGGDAYTVKYDTFNNEMIFNTYAGGGTGGNVIFRTGTSSSTTERLRITSGGNVGIGTSSPNIGGVNKALTLNAATSTNASYELAVNDVLQGSLYTGISTSSLNLYTFVNGPLVFGTNSAERMRITSGGQFQFGNNAPANAYTGLLFGSGTTSQSYGLKIIAGSSSSDIAFLVKDKDDSGERFKIRGDGIIFAPPIYNNTTAVAANITIFGDGSMYRSTSSLKYKTDVIDYTKGLSEVMQLRPVSYKGKNDGDKVFAGLIAEEVHDLGLTEFVQYAEDDTPDALSYSHMVALLTKAIQELNEKIKILENK